MEDFTLREKGFGYLLRWLETVSSTSKTHILMGHCTHSISVDAKIMVSKHCPIIGEQVSVNFVAQ